VILRHAFIPPDNARLAHLCGSFDEHLHAIEAGLDVKISRRNESFRIEGPKQRAQQAVALLQSLYGRARRPISPEKLQLALVEAALQAWRTRLTATVARLRWTPSRSRSNCARGADLVGRTPISAPTCTTSSVATSRSGSAPPAPARPIAWPAPSCARAQRRAASS
jgi:hypothetical protein